jgi:hypothetical protein
MKDKSARQSRLTYMGNNLGWRTPSTLVFKALMERKKAFCLEQSLNP